ncbi:MAG: hypothetical protein U1C72_01890 [Candidatus Pacearchaeota archaeon]|nr:hypothetical protein [Candidatus Pacearchaeota archaeon]
MHVEKAARAWRLPLSTSDFHQLVGVSGVLEVEAGSVSAALLVSLLASREPAVAWELEEQEVRSEPREPAGAWELEAWDEQAELEVAGVSSLSEVLPVPVA